jgi:hypothetical protein
MDVCLGAYATEADAIAAMADRSERQAEMTVVEDGDTEHPWRIWWNRA